MTKFQKAIIILLIALLVGIAWETRYTPFGISPACACVWVFDRWTGQLTPGDRS